MAFTVTIRQHRRPIMVENGQTILDAALAQNVPYPHGCQSGNCGTCKSRLYGGDVEMAPYSEYALSAGEKADGLVLACRAVPRSDVEVGWLGMDETVLHPRRLLLCRVTTLDSVTHDTKRVRLEIENGGPFAFSAGQYARVSFGGHPPRDYSMANRPDDPVLEFHVRQMAGGASYRYVAERLGLGEVARVEGPFGSSFLRERHTGPIIAIAGGSGLAPIKSIVETALALGMRQPIHLYFGVREERDVYLEDHFLALAARHSNFNFIPVISHPSAATGRRAGMVHDAVDADHDSFDGRKAYLAGPPAMVEAATALLHARGMRREDIHADAFYTEADKPRLETPA